MLKITEAVTVLIHTPLQDLAKEIELKNLFNIVQEAITLSEAANDVRLPGTVNKTPLSNTANDNALSTTANDDALSETANDIALPNSANNAKLLQKANDISLSTIVKGNSLRSIVKLRLDLLQKFCISCGGNSDLAIGELPDHDYRIADIEGYKWESIRKGFRFLMACRELAEEYVASPLKRKRNTKTYATTRFPDSPRHQIQAAIRTGSKLIKLQHDLEATSRPPLLLLFATTPRLLGRNNTNDILEDLKSPELSEAMNLVIKYAQLETEAYDAYKAKAIRFRTQVMGPQPKMHLGNVVPGTPISSGPCTHRETMERGRNGTWGLPWDSLLEYTCSLDKEGYPGNSADFENFGYPYALLVPTIVCV